MLAKVKLQLLEKGGSAASCARSSAARNTQETQLRCGTADEELCFKGAASAYGHDASDVPTEGVSKRPTWNVFPFAREVSCKRSLERVKRA